MTQQQELINEIHLRQLENLYKYTDFRKFISAKSFGLYWIWTDLSLEELKKTEKPIIDKEVPIISLIENRNGLKYISDFNKNGFRVIYNGIGGAGKGKWSLRSRINQEFKAQGKTVGTLNIAKKYKTKLDNFRISFFDFNDTENVDLLNVLEMYINRTKSKDDDELKIKKGYIKDLETIWRLEYGTPILCRH